MAQGEADFGICSIPTHEPDTRFETPFDDPMVLALPAGHALARASRVPWERLDGEAPILPARGTGNSMLIDDAAACAGRALTWTFEAARSARALALVAEGAGIAVLPLSSLRSLGDERVIRRPLAGPAIARPVGLLTRTGQADTAQVAALKAAIRDTAAPARPPGTTLPATGPAWRSATRRGRATAPPRRPPSRG